MNGNVHMQVGAAAAASTCLLLKQDDIFTFCVAIGVGAVSSLIPDIDANGESKFKNLFKKIVIGLFISAALYIIYMKLNHLSLDILLKDTDFLKQMMPPIILFVLCLIGFFTPHRTFTHWLITAPLFTYPIYLMFGKEIAIFFLVGYVSHILIDMLNEAKKYRVLFPIPINCSLNVCPSTSTLSSVIGFICMVITIIEGVYIYVLM